MFKENIVANKADRVKFKGTMTIIYRLGTVND